MNRFVHRGTSVAALALLVWLAGCAAAPDHPATHGSGPDAVPRWEFDETAPPDGDFRFHRLARCPEDGAVPGRVERYLGIASEFYRDGSGSDGMIELELGLADGLRHPLMLLTLGQLYLMAGQGDPALLPVEGPAADVGDWPRNRRRLLGRARDLLLECQESRPDDAAVDYLLADVARAAGRFDEAAELVWAGEQKCTGGRSFRILQGYQQLGNYAPKYLGGPAPDYPAAALAAGIVGDVVLDLLLDPRGNVRQAVVVASPDPALTRAAENSLAAGAFEAARIGKYAVWSWLRVRTAFQLEGDPATGS